MNSLQNVIHSQNPFCILNKSSHANSICFNSKTKNKKEILEWEFLFLSSS